MNNHVTVCLTLHANGKWLIVECVNCCLYGHWLIYLSIWKGIYANLEHGIKGASGAMIIHCNKSQNVEQNTKEWECQCQGEEPTPLVTWQRFLYGISLPEVTVVSNTSGLSTQETFYHYCQHFVSSIVPANKREPIILLLDGHASHWNMQALCLLMINQIFPFFLPSHTSIWSQPNDASINIGFHAAVEKAAKNVAGRQLLVAECQQCNTRMKYCVMHLPYFP